MRTVAILGAGAAGMMAAVTLAEIGCQVLLFEKTDRVGKKIMATGNGRCNLSNQRIELSDYHGSCTSLFSSVYESFDLQETLRFFESIGIPVREEEGKLFPYNLQASSVQDAFRFEMERLGVETHLSEPILQIQKEKNGFRIRSKNASYNVDRVILTTGGKASPQLGSDGEGYALCKRMGIRVTPVFPSLVKLTCRYPYLKRLSGVKVLGSVKIGDGKKWLREESGEVLFTDDGISGPPVLQVSGMQILLRRDQRPVYVSIDHFPEKNLKQVEQLLSGLFRRLSYKTVTEALNGLLHKKIIPVLLIEAGIDKNMPAEALHHPEIAALAALLKSWKLEVTGDAGFKNAQVTSGGIHRSEVTENLESVKYPGLFFAGEVLDLDGDCGGYNLQWAWSSGHLAAIGAGYGE